MAFDKTFTFTSTDKSAGLTITAGTEGLKNHQITVLVGNRSTPVDQQTFMDIIAPALKLFTDNLSI